MRQFILIVIATTLINILIGCKAEHDPPSMTKEQIDTMIQRDLPVGTPRAELIAYLDQKKIEHSGNAISNPATIVSIFRNVAGATTTVKKAIQVTFVFRDDRLANYSVEEKFTGP